MIDSQINNRVANFGASRIKLAMTRTAEVIMDAVRSSARALWTPGNLIRTDRDGNTPGHCNIAARSTCMNSPVLIGGTTASTTSGIMESHEIVSIHHLTYRDYSLRRNSVEVLKKIIVYYILSLKKNEVNIEILQRE